jgi:radical S-adenosyl methionine domain-containing protein 2
MCKIFEAVSFHIVKPCNMKCKFCYATFDDMHVGPQMSLTNAERIVLKLKKAGVQKITFAGGEPMLYKHIKAIIQYAKAIGFTTSIITNGSLLTQEWLAEMMPYLDWIGISIDSLNGLTNAAIGRTAYREVKYRSLIALIKDMGFRLKINTVVNAHNWHEDMAGFIGWAKPDRWKVFQTLKVEGQNDEQFDKIAATDEEFKNFIMRHEGLDCMVPEDNELMTGSYLLIDPLGRMFENSAGKHTYSDSLIESTTTECLEQINLNRNTFEKRGGIYAW